MMQWKPPSKKLMLMELFISIVIVFRVQIYDVNIFIYYLLLISLIIGKYFKQGNTVGSIFQYISTICLILSEVCQISILTHIGIMLVVINYFLIAPTLYTLPVFDREVGFKDSSFKQKNNREYYVVEWYPIEQKQNIQQYKINWSHTREIEKMSKYMKINNRILMKIFQFFNSYVKHYQLIFYKGTIGKYNGVILFSHGRGATPFMYSSILKYFAKYWKILSPQHSQVNVTPFTDMNEIKKFREKQVKERAQQIVNLADKKEKYVLMGHSYGCPTVLQAYYSMSAENRKQVSHIVLLDPWLFPLTEQVFNQEIQCPLLILGNQYFLELKDVNQRNRKYVNLHKQKMIYICWKGGDHLHQTDLSFIVGNSLNKIKNSKQCWAMMKRNIEAIDMFLQCEKVSQEIKEKFRNKFGEYDLGIEYTTNKYLYNLKSRKYRMQQKNDRKYKYHKEYKNNEYMIEREIKQIEQKLSEEKKKKEQYERKIDKIYNNIKNEEERLLKKYNKQQQKQRKQIQRLLNEIMDKNKQYIYQQNKNKQQIVNINQYLSIKKQSLKQLQKQKQNYFFNGINQSFFNQQISKIQSMKINIQKIQQDILSNDPLKYQEQMRESFYQLNTILDNQQNDEQRAKDDLSIKQLQQSIEKNKLVIQLGKYQQLKRQTQQKQQTLKSLNRHSQQIQERVSMMRKQKKLLKKNTIIKNNNEIIKQIQKFQQQNQKLIQQIEQQQQKLYQEDQYLNKCVSKEKYYIYIQQLEILQKNYKILYQNNSNKNNIQDKNKKYFLLNKYQISQNLKKLYNKLENIKKMIQNKKSQLTNLSKQNQNSKKSIQTLLQQLNIKKEENKNLIPEQQNIKTKQNTEITINKENKIEIEQPPKQITCSWLFIILIIIIHIFALGLIYYNFQ